jgi:hypothetical protein
MTSKMRHVQFCYDVVRTIANRLAASLLGPDAGLIREQFVALRVIAN